MQITCYRITENAYIEEMSSEAFIEPWKQGKGLYFVDVQQCSSTELEKWLRNLNISDLAISCCVESRKVSTVIPLANEVFFELPVCLMQSETGLIDHFVSFLCLNNLVITMYTDPITDADRFVEILKSQLTLAYASTSALVSILLARESFNVTQVVEKLRSSVFELDERMDREPDSVEADEIREQKRKLRTYDTLANGQAACFDQLRALKIPFFNFMEISTYFQLASANALAASQAVLRLDKTIFDLNQRFDMNQQEKTNHRLAVLTILSAIFMPITLLAGIYGMNFDNMPELHFTWSYPVLIILMLLIAGGLYHYFKKGGWLD